MSAIVTSLSFLIGESVIIVNASYNPPHYMCGQRSKDSPGYWENLDSEDPGVLIPLSLVMTEFLIKNFGSVYLVKDV